ncbi:myb-binding protein 1A [Anopheles moucheti]|uniref:myb-binding protein 1A n=1 Tax=Anopheles moucheti TaxID=186751 RepID=UPI0022F08625|nr:myb-binding protein 1A [Anopheles moucheti]
MKEQPGRKAGMLMDKTVFGYFKRLISEDDGVRVNGACGLIDFLCKERTNKPQNGNSDVAEETVAPKMAETAYALKRLIRGVGSKQNASRVGFFTALVGLLEQLKSKDDVCPSVTELFNLVKSELTEVEGEKKEKQTTRLELRIGKVLVCGAIIKSGLVESASEMELQTVIKTLKKAMHVLLTPLVYAFLNELTNRLSATMFSAVFWPVFEPLLNVPKENHTIDTVHFLLQLSIGPHKKLINSKYFERNFGVTKLLHENNFAFLSELLFGVGNTMGINHPFFECLLEQLNEQHAMVPFWRDNIVPVLEEEKHRNKRRLRDIIVLRTVISIFGRLEDYTLVPEILHPTFIKFLVNNLKNRSTHSEDVRGLYQEVCDALLTCYPKITDESVRLATFRLLMNAPGSIMIDKYANCKLLHNLLITLSTDSLRTIAGELQAFMLDETTSTNGERSYAAQFLQRIFSLRQLVPTANDKEPTDSWHQDVVRFFLTLGVFYSKDGVNVLKGAKHNEAISSELATTMRGMFFHSLEHHHTKLSNERAFLLATVRYMDDVLRMHGIKSLRSPLTDEQMNCWHKMFATVASEPSNKLQSKKPSSTRGGDTQCEIVFHILLMHMGLHLFNDPEVACSSINELECVMKRIDEKMKQRQKSNGEAKGENSKKRKSVQHTTIELEPAEPEWIEVVVDLFLNLLSQNSHLLRKVIGHLFPHLSGEITLPALNQILSVINLKDKSNPLTMNGEDENESDTEEVIEEEKDSASESGEESDAACNDDNKKVVDNNEVEEEEEDDDDELMGDEEEEENISDTMRQAIQTALGGANPETDTESVDLDELDEEQGRRMDEALAAAFRAFRKSKPSRKRKGPTKAEKQMDTVLTHFRMRVLDLIDAYLKHEPDMLLCLELMLYIFEMLPVGLREESKYGVILNRYRHIFTTLIHIKKFKRDAESVRIDQLVQIVHDLIEKVAKGVAFPERNQYLLKACQFVVICSQVLTKDASDEPNGVDKMFGELLAEFITNRNPSLAFGVFQSLFRMQWCGVWHLVDKLVNSGLKISSVRAIRRIQSLQLLREFLRNRRLINSDQPRSAAALRTISDDALVPYVSELEAAVTGGDRSIGQNEFYELLLVLNELQSLSSVGSNSKKANKKHQLLHWDKIGAHVQSMRLFAINSQTMTTYRQFCHRLHLTPISNEGLPAVKEKGSIGVTVETATDVVTAKKGGAKKRKSILKETANGEEAADTAPLMNGQGMNGNSEEEEGQHVLMESKQSGKRKRKHSVNTSATNGHSTNGGSVLVEQNGGDEQEVVDATNASEGGEIPRKRKKDKKQNGDTEVVSSKKQKRLLKEARLQAASEGMEGISFARAKVFE